MKIEAICAAKGPHFEYLVRVSHKELMMLGAVNFVPDEELNVLHSLTGPLESAMNQIRYAMRALAGVK